MAQLRPGSPTVSPAATTAEDPPNINAIATITEVSFFVSLSLLISGWAFWIYCSYFFTCLSFNAGN
jgi:hypothetical protein